jgi:hypothetical protein
MFKFWCSICIDDKELYADSVDNGWGYAICPDCGSTLKEPFSRHKGITDEEMTTESYRAIHGLDNNTP